MLPVFICYSKCATCQKAKKWLETNGIAFEERPIREQRPALDELRVWQKRSGLPLRRFFNTSGQLYRQMELTKKLPEMTEEEMLLLLASDGMLVKRPLLVTDNAVLVGFQAAEWASKLHPDR